VILEQIKSAVEFATHLPRYHEILKVLFRYGFADVLKLVALQKLLGIDDAELTVHESGLLAKPPQERLRLALEELGPTFIKFGQILSSRRDFVTDEYYEELCKLHDEVPTFPGSEAKRIIKEDLEARAEELFATFDADALAGASIAQVHVGTLHDGTKVAIKVQRPDIWKTIALDLAIIADLARFLDRHVPEIAVLNPVGVVHEFSETLKKELDFTNEAVNAERFGQQFEENANIYVPRIFRDVSSERVLTMEFISGVRINDVPALEANGIDPVQLSERTTVLIYEMIFDHGFFHGDPHPGNITILEEGVVGLYDYGMMGSFTPAGRGSIARLIAGLAEKNHQLVMRSIIDLSEEGYVENADRMLRDVEEFSDTHLNLPLKDINLGFVLNKLLELLRDNELRMKGSFYLGIKALTQVEAIGRELNPDLNFVILGKPYAERLIEKKYEPFHLWSLLKKLVTETVDFLDDFPHDFRTLYNRVKRGQISIPLEHNINPEGFEPLRKTLDSIANRLTNAVLAASVLICSSIVVLAHVPPLFHGVSVPGAVGLGFGSYMCLRLVFSIWKHGGL
jgi:ubiquinone biosynthesis protein